MRVLDRDPETRLGEKLDVVLAVAERDHVREVDPEQLGDERDPGALRRAGMPELEQVRKRRREVEALAELALEVEADLGEPRGLGDRDELRRLPLEPSEEVADLGDREALEAGVGARVLGLLGDVEPVVDVDVRREPVRLQRRDRLPRDVELERLVQEELARPRDRPRRRPGSRRPARGSPPARGTARPSGTSGPSRRGPALRRPVTARSRRASAPRAPRGGRSASRRGRRRRPARAAGSRRRGSAADGASRRRRTPRRPRSAVARAARRTRACRPGRA